MKVPPVLAAVCGDVVQMGTDRSVCSQMTAGSNWLGEQVSSDNQDLVVRTQVPVDEA